MLRRGKANLGSAEIKLMASEMVSDVAAQQHRPGRNSQPSSGRALRAAPDAMER
jgi:hypothetical protein